VNARRAERGEPPLATGVGVNTGPVTAGSLGASDRLHYTILGDTVNTTQRLEALTRKLLEATGVLVGQPTYLALGDLRAEFHFQPLGSHAIKGKSEQVELYQLLVGDELAAPERGDWHGWASRVTAGAQSLDL
jgi:adenylate cyclase